MVLRHAPERTPEHEPVDREGEALATGSARRDLTSPATAGRAITTTLRVALTRNILAISDGGTPQK